MDLTAIISKVITGNTADSIGKATGVDQQTVERVIAAGLPVILGQMANNTASSDGAAALDAAVAKDHAGGSLLESITGLFTGGDTNTDGSKILEHVLGNDQTTATQSVAKQTGVDAATVVKILTFLAPLVMAYLAKKKATDNLDAGGLSDVLQQQTATNGNPLSQIATAMLDKNHDGSIVDDLLGGLFGKKS